MLNSTELETQTLCLKVWIFFLNQSTRYVLEPITPMLLPLILFLFNFWSQSWFSLPTFQPIWERNVGRTGAEQGIGSPRSKVKPDVKSQAN